MHPLNNEQKQDIARQFVEDPKPWAQPSGNVYEYALCDIGDVTIIFAYSYTKPCKPGLGLSVQQDDPEDLLNRLKQLKFDALGFKLNEDQLKKNIEAAKKKNAKTRTLYFFRNGCETPEDAYAQIVSPGQDVTVWRAFFKELVSQVNGIVGVDKAPIYSGDPVSSGNTPTALASSQSAPSDNKGKPLLPRNLIFFGAPGTGKSYKVDNTVAKDDTAIRTTFHPDSDYASFLGAYKPTMEPTKDGDRIVYRFVPQAFTKAYVQAWEKMAQAEDGKAAAPQYLVIEEINRGNCAQIFGDLFQLLDRADNGYSKYPINPDTDLATYLGKNLKDAAPTTQAAINQDLVNAKANATWSEVRIGEKLVLPPNLYIWATMNTSDQSLFPMDSAFKRRWEWKYSKIKNEKKDYKIKVAGQELDWWKFLEKINAVIRNVTQSADKQLGYFFVKLPDDLPEDERIIDAETFVNKVIFYLWNDVFRDCELDADAFMVHNKDEKDSENNTNSKRQLTFDDFFEDDGGVKEKAVTDFLSNLLPKNTENRGTGETSPASGGVPVPEAVSPDAIKPEQQAGASA